MKLNTGERALRARLTRVKRARSALARGVLASLGMWGGVGCGADDGDFAPRPPADAQNNAQNNARNNAQNNAAGQPDADVDMGQSLDAEPPFVPEREEFLVRTLAATDSYVFVPNSSPTGDTVARIDGRDLKVTPLRVGLRPTAVAATQVQGQGAVAYALCEGSAQVSIIRADAPREDGRGLGRVTTLRVPREVNALAMAPDGRHALLYIDPTRPLPAGASVASLQVMALVRLGDGERPDQVLRLSVTRQIRDVALSQDGRLAAIVGQEGVHLLELDAPQGDVFLSPLDLGPAASALPPSDMEVELAPDGSFLVARTSQQRGVLLMPLGQGAPSRFIELPDIPTDLDLVSGQAQVDGLGARQILVTLREAAQLVIVDVDEALATPADQQVALRRFELPEVRAGLAQLTPDQSGVLLYSSLELTPTLGLLSLEDQQVRTFPLRNQIRSVALSRDSQSALIVHRAQGVGAPAPWLEAQERFTLGHGLTLLHLPTGYQRPMPLEAEPLDLIMAQNGQGASLVFLLMSPEDDPARQGLLRLNMRTGRADALRVDRRPTQLGQVAQKIFVVQEADQGRITFIDIDSGQQRTVSGYELNARIE